MPERVRLGAGYRKLYLATAVSNIGDGMAGIAYPWLATAITRNPLLVALVAAVQRLPWLFFTLPAGVITDRVDRKRAMVVMDSLRFVFTLAVAFAVLAEQGMLPAPDEVQSVVGTRVGLYLVLLLATLLLGCAEVLRDNCNQTFLPSIVAPEHLERANGRIWSIESAANTFIGPPIGSLLLVSAFSAPFFVDAGSFFLAAALVAGIPGTFRAAGSLSVGERPSWRADLKEGFTWLWHNRLLRSMAILLGTMNLSSNLSGSLFVLFAQDVLRVTPWTFTLMGFGFALGAIAGGYVGPWLSKRLGSGTCLAVAVFAMAVTQAVTGFLSSWVLVAVVAAVGASLSTLWNVVTVSFRQQVIPDELLGRVNSVYRFFAWGSIPLGAALGGLVVLVARWFVADDTALRIVWWVDGALTFVVFLFVRRLLTTERLEAARAAATGVAR
jgi:MFS family permease